VHDGVLNGIAGVQVDSWKHAAPGVNSGAIVCPQKQTPPEHTEPAPVQSLQVPPSAPQNASSSTWHTFPAQHPAQVV
jgi:hypothetical protein